MKKTLKQEVIEEHGYPRCQNCGSNQACHEHHIIYRSEAPKHVNLHNKRNRIFICVPCHNWFHSKKSNRNNIVKERKLWELFDHLKNIP